IGCEFRKEAPRRRTEVTKNTFRTAGLPGLAGFPAVVDQHVVKIEPVLLRDKPQQVLFDLLRVALPAESEPAGEPLDVGVDGDPPADSIAGGQDDVGGFAGDAGEGG